MPDFVSKKTLYLNADRSKVVAEDDADATYLLAREGAVVAPEAVERYKVAVAEAETYDAVADHEAKHGAESEEQARAARRRMLEGEPDPDGPAVEGERGEKAAAPKANKAKAAAENK
jgi:hypothetical protein